MSATVSCKSCGKPVPVGDRFCSGCGSSVVVAEAAATVMMPHTHGGGTNATQCAKCGASMGRDDKFCPKCGATRLEEATVVSHLSLRNAQAAHLIEATKGDFEILHALGTGAMGAVYLAKDISLGRKVAIKVIATNLLSDATMISRFRFEAQTVASLRHSNIVNVHAVRQSADLHYFVMEFIDGPPLRNIVKTHAPLDVDVVQAILFQVGSALAYAHRSAGGVIHRDVKPANIMIDKEGDAFVTDFGISKMSEAQTGLTQTGATIGTPEYMSPEQCRGDPLSGSSDQYSLGIVAYEMLVGHVPFTGSQYNIMVSHTSEQPKPLLVVRPDCPPQVAEAIERMLAKTPQERWPDLDSAVTAMGGAPLGYQSPVRQKIKYLTGATLTSVPAVRTGQPSAVSGGRGTLDTATSVSVMGLPPILETGERFQLKADVKGSGNSSLSGLGVVWASTDPSIAKVDGGWVEALAPGSVSITASAGNVASSVLLTIQEPKPAKVLVRPAAVNMQRGGKIALTALVQDKRGKEIPKPIRWKSSDPAIATVSPKGEVVAKAGGPVTITAETEGASGTAAIVVEAPVVVAPPSPAPTPALAPKPAPAPVAAAAKAATPTAPVAKPKAPAPRPAPSGERPWYKHPGAIAASVVLLGGAAAGIVTMTGGGGSSSPGVDAVPGAATTASPSPSAATGVETPPAQTPLPTSSAPSQTGSQPPATTPSGAPTGSTTSAAPNPEPTRPAPTPTATQTLTTATQPPPPVSSPSGSSPTAPAPARVDIGQVAASVQQGATGSASAQVFGSGGAAMGAGTYTLAWRSSNPAAVTVDQRSGAYRAAGPGAAWIVATAGSARDSVRVTVAPTVAAVDIAGSDLTLDVGDPARALTASVLDSNRQPMQRPLTWSSSDPGVASVDGNGRVTPVGSGTAQITATADGRSDQVSVTVAAAAAPTPAPAPAPRPAPVAAAPALPSSAEARSAIDAYVAALGRNDRDTVTRLWGSAPEGDRGDLLDLMGQRNLVVTLGTVSNPVLDGAAAAVTFAATVAYRTSFGQNRSQDFNFRARLERSGAQWVLASAVLQ